MIIEGLLTTQDAEGAPHVAPMGPVVDVLLEHWILRPFQSSQTFARLRQDPRCVFHVVDDVLPVVTAALGLPAEYSLQQSERGIWILSDACRWFELRVQSWNLDAPRSEAQAVVVASGELRPFWGWNRAKHAILEATILATRLQLIGHAAVEEELAKLDTAVHKTAGPRELEAWRLVHEFVQRQGTK